MKHVLAQTATIDAGRGTVSIDGVVLPWWLEGDGPTIEKMDDLPMLIVNIPVLVESAVTEITGHGARGDVWDPVLGNLRVWAQRFVRDGFKAAYPDLEVEP